MTLNGIHIDEEKLATFCRANGIRQLLLFGSILRDDFTPESDVDVIVEFENLRKPDLFRFAGMQTDLGELFDRPVHLHTDMMLHPGLRNSILRSAKPAYAA